MSLPQKIMNLNERLPWPLRNDWIGAIAYFAIALFSSGQPHWLAPILFWGSLFYGCLCLIMGTKKILRGK